eukprot:Sspe_Gene.116267::Locus_105065_Transcript_1_2_Confidence_0.750_Length_518::g.116267::m.116267
MARILWATKGRAAACVGAVAGMAELLRHVHAEDALRNITLTNYSLTHSSTASCLHQPRTAEDVRKVLQDAQRRGAKVRVVGSGLSPNGIGLPENGGEAISLVHMDEVLGVDVDKMEVTVQAGCSVRGVQEYLEPFGLTLQNFSSISDQQ